MRTALIQPIAASVVGAGEFDMQDWHRAMLSVRICVHGAYRLGVFTVGNQVNVKCKPAVTDCESCRNNMAT